MAGVLLSGINIGCMSLKYLCPLQRTCCSCCGAPMLKMEEPVASTYVKCTVCGKLTVLSEQPAELDGMVDDEKTCFLADVSYELTKKGRKSELIAVEMTMT